MPFRVETGLLNPETDKYAGGGQEVMGIEGIAAAARKVEELGFDAAMTPEAGLDPFLPLMIAAEHTKHIALGTNVAVAFPRSPMVVAQVAWDLQRFSRGRFRLGLGTQVKGHNERRYAAPWTAPPGPRLREYIQCLKAMFATFQNGKNPSYFTGQHYQFSLMVPLFNPGPIAHPHVPIYIAVVNKYMAGLAGELCDGIRLHPIATFKYTKEILMPVIEKGTQKAGRQLSDIDMVGAPFLAIGADAKEVEAAKNALRQKIGFYASTRTYHTVLDFHGWHDTGMKLHQLSVDGKWRELPALITDEMLEEWAIIATYDEFAAKVKQRCSGIFDTILLDLPPKMRENETWLRGVVQALHQA